MSQKPPNTSCPDKIQRLLLDILYHTLLYIRARADNRKIVYGFSDHAHNIPSLIEDFTKDKLKYYCESEVKNITSFIGEEDIPKPFKEAWSDLKYELNKLPQLSGKNFHSENSGKSSGCSG